MSATGKPPQSDDGIDNEFIDDFSPEWCQKILKDPSYQHITPWTRTPNTDGSTWKTLMSKTLSTDSTIRSMKFFYKPGQTPNAGHLLALVSVGGGLCGHLDTLHGGTNMVLIAEIGAGLAGAGLPDETLMAANFNVSLRRRVRGPGLILGRAWFEKPPQGRKIWVKVQYVCPASYFVIRIG